MFAYHCEVRRELSIFVCHCTVLEKEASGVLNALKDRIREVENEQFLSETCAIMPFLSLIHI